MRRPLPRDPSEYTAREGQAVEAAYTNRRVAVVYKAKELVVEPEKILELIDGGIAVQLAKLMYAHARDGDVLREANALYWEILARAVLAADYMVPEVDEEQIFQQMEGDRESSEEGQSYEAGDPTQIRSSSRD